MFLDRSLVLSVGLCLLLACSAKGKVPRWEPQPIEMHQSPLLLPIAAMTDVTTLCTPAPCANGTALRNAIVTALAQGKRALFFPAGEHALVGDILLPSGTTIAGLGPSSVL